MYLGYWYKAWLGNGADNVYQTEWAENRLTQVVMLEITRRHLDFTVKHSLLSASCERI